MHSFPKHRSVFALAAIAASFVLTTPNAKAALPVGSSAWTWQNPLPQGNDLRAVSCPSENTCIVVGDFGTILTTTNALNIPPTFSSTPPLTSQNLLGVSCASTTSCVAVGASGTILVYGLESIFCNPITHTCTSLYGWLVEPSSSTGIPSNVGLNAVSCPSASVCLAVGANDVFVTQNGGSTWTTIFSGSSSSDLLTGISCPSTTVCWAVGRQINGGMSGQVLEVFNNSGWHTVPWSTGTPNGLQAISCPAVRDCVAVDTTGNAIHTTDAPLGWSLTPVSPFNLALVAISCAVSGTTTSCVASGQSFTSPENIFLTSTNGSSWTAVNSHTAFDQELKGLSCLDSGCAALVVGIEGAMVYSAGTSFGYSIESFANNPGVALLTRASCPAEGTCFAVGDQGTIAGDQAVILATTDFGSTWKQEASGTSQELDAIDCPSTSTCYAVGDNGTILNLAGGSWHTQSSGTTVNLVSISCPSVSVCIASAAAVVQTTTSSLLFTNNGGVTWTNVASINGMDVFPSGLRCSGLSPTICFVALFNGQILQATVQSNGSTIVNPTPVVNTGANLLDLSCPTLTTCTAVGNGGAIWSNQSGVWAKQASPIAANLRGVSCLLSSSTSTVCAAVSNQGYIISSSGASWTKQAPVQVDNSMLGASCAGNAQSSPPAYQCLGVGAGGTIVSLVVGNTGVGTLTPSHGSSQVGDETAFQLTWTVPAGKVWRDLDHLDLNFTDDSGKVGLAARFYVGATASDPSTFAVLDANGNVAGQGLPGATGTIQTSTFVLDLANSSFQGSGPTGPTVTINFAVIFKPEAAGNGVAEEAAHVYNLDISGTDRITDTVQSQQVGMWAVRQTY